LSLRTGIMVSMATWQLYLNDRGIMDYIPAKTIVTKNKNPDSWFGHDYNMNIYKGCSHGCIYCDSRSECYRVDDFDRVRAKQDALSIINRELNAKKSGVVGTGAMSDPYNPYEEELKLTRSALELISNYGFGVSIATKSDLITRDIDILKEIGKHSPVCIKLTITTFDNDLCSRIEPNVARSSARFEALRHLAGNGLFCGVLIMPVLPFINDDEDNMKNIIKTASEVGARFVYPWFGVTLRLNQREYFYEQLDKHFPDMKSKYVKAYGNRYECSSQSSKQHYRLVAELCNKYGLLYQMPQIIKAYKYIAEPVQLSFW
jgi:DNA repair photolyase